MKHANMLIGFIIIALLSISFVSCEEDRESLKPIDSSKPIGEQYPLRIPSSEIPSDFTLDWSLLRENGQYKDKLIIITSQVSFDIYILSDNSLEDYKVDFSKNIVLLAYTWTRNSKVSEVFDTLWKLNPNEYRWDIEYKYSGVTSPSIGELANVIVIPKPSCTHTISLNVIDGGTHHPIPTNK